MQAEDVGDFQLGIRTRGIRNTITGIVPLKTQNSSLKTIPPFTRSGYDEVISGFRFRDTNTETASPSADGSQRVAIFNIQQGTFNVQLGIGGKVKKRKSSFEGGAGMSGANAGGGCWLCSIRNR